MIYEDDSHIIEKQEQGHDLLEKGIRNRDLTESIIDLLTEKQKETIIYMQINEELEL